MSLHLIIFYQTSIFLKSLYIVESWFIYYTYIDIKDSALEPSRISIVATLETIQCTMWLTLYVHSIVCDRGTILCAINMLTSAPKMMEVQSSLQVTDQPNTVRPMQPVIAICLYFSSDATLFMSRLQFFPDLSLSNENNRSLAIFTLPIHTQGAPIYLQ